MGVGDLCDQGRCAQILRAIAEAKVVERVAERNAETMVTVLTGALGRLGVDASEERVRAAVAAEIEALVGSARQVEGVAV